MDADEIRRLSNCGERLIPEDTRSAPMYVSGLSEYRFFLEHLPPQGPVVDLGCGEGYGTNALAERLNPIIGVDFDEQILIRASKKYRENAPYFVRMSLEQIGLMKNAFNGAVCTNVLEHLAAPEQFVRDAWSLVKSGGVMIIGTPNKEWDPQWASVEFNEHHLKEYTKEEFQDLFGRVCGENATFYGLNCSDRVRCFLHDRLLGEGTIRTLVQRDRFNLRKIVPKPVRRIVENALRASKRNAENQVQQEAGNINFDDYWFSQEFESCLEFFAVCKKP